MSVHTIDYVAQAHHRIDTLKASIELKPCPTIAYLRADLMKYVQEYRETGDIASATEVDDRAAYIVNVYGEAALPLAEVSITELTSIAAFADKGL